MNRDYGAIRFFMPAAGYYCQANNFAHIETRRQDETASFIPYSEVDSLRAAGGLRQQQR
jgi:hypothetical protein